MQCKLCKTEATHTIRIRGYIKNPSKHLLILPSTRILNQDHYNPKNYQNTTSPIWACRNCLGEFVKRLLFINPSPRVLQIGEQIKEGDTWQSSNGKYHPAPEGEVVDETSPPIYRTWKVQVIEL